MALQEIPIPANRDFKGKMNAAGIKLGQHRAFHITVSGTQRSYRHFGIPTCRSIKKQKTVSGSHLCGKKRRQQNGSAMKKRPPDYHGNLYLDLVWLARVFSPLRR
jgi:hypothetical protein